MLSVLIPTYNYDVTLLVKTLHKQLIAAGILFEILVFDDASNQQKYILENKEINNLANSTYKVLPQNIGRSKIRNLLAKSSKYNWLLFLDADMIIINTQFISNYLNAIKKKYQVVNGGIEYQKEKPMNHEVLRWVYGKKREALTVEQRDQKPYLSFFSSNFLICKKIFSSIQFNDYINKLRHEDTLFAIDLKKNKTPIINIKNPVIHAGLESSKIFLKKSEESVKAIKYMTDLGLIDKREIKIIKYSTILAPLKGIYLFVYRLIKKRLIKNILSKSPSLILFDLYRLGYLFSIKK